eukprot:TRINITY_DN4927_c0_g1_i1.p1 TRINITY_DN4927_c0_g1~~TRINITY_DN4927_c0_g1_i1.p1  ORF type:complete len:331 (-),score=104.24 TRINITY_DN4927_c0_g1_i1:6-998(-)
MNTTASNSEQQSKDAPANQKEGGVVRKRRIRQNINPKTIVASNAVPKLFKDSKNTKFTQSSVLAKTSALLDLYRVWAKQWCGTLPFEEVVARLEKFSKNTTVRQMLEAFRHDEDWNYERDGTFLFNMNKNPTDTGADGESTDIPDDANVDVNLGGEDGNLNDLNANDVDSTTSAVPPPATDNSNTNTNTPTTDSLSNEQIDRIQKNKEAALARKREREEMELRKRLEKEMEFEIDLEAETELDKILRGEEESPKAKKQKQNDTHNELDDEIVIRPQSTNNEDNNTNDLDSIFGEDNPGDFQIDDDVNNSSLSKEKSNNGKLPDEDATSTT